MDSMSGCIISQVGTRRAKAIVVMYCNCTENLRLPRTIPSRLVLMPTLCKSLHNWATLEPRLCAMYLMLYRSRSISKANWRKTTSRILLQSGKGFPLVNLGTALGFRMNLALCLCSLLPPNFSIGALTGLASFIIYWMPNGFTIVPTL